MIPESTRGIVYLCDFDGIKLTVNNEILCDSAFEALEYYANIPNPESQMVSGDNYNAVITELNKLHDDMVNPKWLDDLADSI